MTLLPVGTVTFLFTDIVGSTRLWDTEPEAMTQAFARHSELITAGVSACNGHLVRVRGEGDSAFSVFRSPADALAAACAFQRALIAEEWPTATPLRVRAALHCGPAELREGDYNSTAVNRCARLRSIAASGQTLVSQVVVEMTLDNLPEGVTSVVAGIAPSEGSAKAGAGLPTVSSGSAVRLRTVAFAWLLADKSPAAAQQFYWACQGDRASGHLPVSTGGRCSIGFSAPADGGRRRRGREARLVVQMGAELLDLYPDGVWLVELAALTEGSMVVQAITTVLGLREESGRTLLTTLQEHLRERSLLLILDNCEHLVADCARVAHALLHACPNVRLVATSRETLNIPGETVWRIPSLSLPEEGGNLSAASVSASEAAQLFTDRAQAVLPSFQVTEQNAGAIAQISRRLDGIPLALELAAARVRSLSAEQIAARLDDRFRLLTGGSRTALPRQQTLRGLIDWSYQLLNERENSAETSLGLLRRLDFWMQWRASAPTIPTIRTRRSRSGRSLISWTAWWRSRWLSARSQSSAPLSPSGDHSSV